MSDVISESEDQILTLTLNRPEKLNCISWEMLRELESQVKKIGADDEIKAVVIRGAGDRSFSTGADLKVYRGLSKDQVSEWLQLGNRVFQALESLSQPTLAVIEGYAYGGGLELALCCDLRLASEKASFCSPEAQLGWMPGWGGPRRLSRLLGESRAKEIVLLSEVLTAEEAHRIGLVNWMVDGDGLEAKLAAILEKLRNLEARVQRELSHEL